MFSLLVKSFMGGAVKDLNGRGMRVVVLSTSKGNVLNNSVPVVDNSTTQVFEV